MKSKVLLIGPVPGPPGGVASVVEAILASPLRQEYGISVLDTAQKKRLRYNPDVPGLLSPFYTIFHLLKLGYLLHAEQPEVVHVQSCSGLGFLRDSLFVVVARAGRTKIVCHFHGMWRRQSPLCRHRVLKSYFRWIMRSVDTLIVLSPRFVSDFDRVIPQTKKCVVPNFASPFTLADRRSPSEMGVLFVGRLSRKKGIYDLVQAAIALQDEPAIHFRLAGLEETPADKDRILSELRDHALQDRVSLAGHVQGRRKAELFACSDVLVLPSYTEIFPMVVLEAMAAALPVIATPVGGVADMVMDGVNGFLVPPGEPELLAERIRYLLHHPRRREEMGQNNLRRFNQEYSLDVNINRIRQIYGSLLRETPEGQGPRREAYRTPTRKDENGRSTLLA
jgi:glycosyltransferase involved in cell wall biosynthesis